MTMSAARLPACCFPPSTLVNPFNLQPLPNSPFDQNRTRFVVQPMSWHVSTSYARRTCFSPQECRANVVKVCYLCFSGLSSYYKGIYGEQVGQLSMVRGKNPSIPLLFNTIFASPTPSRVVDYLSAGQKCEQSTVVVSNPCKRSSGVAAS